MKKHFISTLRLLRFYDSHNIDVGDWSSRRAFEAFKLVNTSGWTERRQDRLYFRLKKLFKRFWIDQFSEGARAFAKVLEHLKGDVVDAIESQWRENLMAGYDLGKKHPMPPVLDSGPHGWNCTHIPPSPGSLTVARPVLTPESLYGQSRLQPALKAAMEFEEIRRFQLEAIASYWSVPCGVPEYKSSISED